MSDIKIYIDDKALTVASSDLSVADLLSEVGCTIDNTVLVTPDGILHDNSAEIVHVSNEDHLKTQTVSSDLKVHYQVNGDNQISNGNRLTVRMILEHAGNAASIDVDTLESYYLENVVTEQRYDDLDDYVVICEGDLLIAVHRGATPVA